MLLDILFYIFVLVSCVNILHFGLYLIGANYYDIARYYKERRGVRRLRFKKPLVTVLIPAHNESLAIERCLDSVRTSSYRKIQVLVIDDASTDNTRELVQAYIAKYPKKNISLLARITNSGKADSLNYALKTEARGELVMTLDADSILERNAIKNAVKYFADPKVVGVAANVRVLDSKTVLGLLQKFEYMIGYRSKRFFTLTNSEFIVGGVASTYRMSTLRKVGFYDDDVQTEDIALSLKIAAEGNREHRLVYGFDVLAMTVGVQSFRQLLRQRYRWKMGNLQSIVKYRRLLLASPKKYSAAFLYYRLPMAYFGELMIILETISFAFVLYLCAQLMSLEIFAGAYLVITLYMLWTVFPDEHMPWKKKLSMAAYAPAMYFIFFIMNVVQIIAIVRCLINYKQILRRVRTGNTWVSPDRSGQQQVEFS